MSNTAANDAIVYVGTYTQKLPHVHGQAEGIYVYRLDRATGALHHLSTASGVVNPSFVNVDAGRRHLYAVQEIGEYEGQPGGAASAFTIDPDTHALTLVNHQPTHGAHPCYVSVDQSGRWLLVANYGGGSVTVLPINGDALGAPSDVVKHEGTPTHHDAPHAHAILSDPAGGYVLAPDCGLDRVFVYTLDTEQGKLLAHTPPWAMLVPGAGPRHLAFHPNGVYLYCINERNSTLTAFRYDAASGVLDEIHTLSTLPDSFSGRNSCADIHIHPSGRFVYGSNRGHDSIAIFTVDPETGGIQAAGHMPTGGRTPRNFGLDPSGSFLLAANQDSGTVVTFRVDQETGALSETGLVTNIPSPVCLCIV